MNRLLTILTLLLTSSCYGQDYSVENSFSHTISADSVNYLIIECYCNNGVEIVEMTTKEIEVNVTGKLESKGYHGDQEKPEKIPEETLSFKTEMIEDTLRLVSKEWTFIHHSYLIDRLSITIPLGLKFEVSNVEGNDLEGREIK